MAARRRRRAASAAEREFVSEAEDILERLREGLARLSVAPDGAAEPELLNELFRSAHSLKEIGRAHV